MQRREETGEPRVMGGALESCGGIETGGWSEERGEAYRGVGLKEGVGQRQRVQLEALCGERPQANHRM
jgi:hypothetical protein